MPRRTFASVSTTPISPKATPPPQREAEHVETGDPIADKYARPMQWMHLLGAVGITFLIGSALAAGSVRLSLLEMKLPKITSRDEKLWSMRPVN